MKTSMKRSLLLSLALGVVALASTACQTTKGFGEDLENVGEKIQDK